MRSTPFLAGGATFIIRTPSSLTTRKPIGSILTAAVALLAAAERVSAGAAESKAEL